MILDLLDDLGGGAESGFDPSDAGSFVETIVVVFVVLVFVGFRLIPGVSNLIICVF